MLKDIDTDAGVLSNIRLICPRCQPTVSFNTLLHQHIVEHIGSHILYDPAVDCSLEPCGLCLWPALQCKIVLKKTKGQTGNLAINMKASLCPNLIKFSLAVAAECSEASPCTNHPIICPYCDSGPAVWSYTFHQHLLNHHLSKSLEDHKSIWTLTKLEKDGMKHVWEHRHKQLKPCAKVQHPPLAISETHRAHLVLRYVWLVLLLNSTHITMLQRSETETCSSTSDEGSVEDFNDEEEVPHDEVTANLMEDDIEDDNGQHDGK